jgi:hypothetical protein
VNDQTNDGDLASAPPPEGKYFCIPAHSRLEAHENFDKGVYLNISPTAPEPETVKINKTDYDLVVKCLNAARERLVSGCSADIPQARIEIDWALVGLGQDIPA